MVLFPLPGKPVSHMANDIIGKVYHRKGEVVRAGSTPEGRYHKHPGSPKESEQYLIFFGP